MHLLLCILLLLYGINYRTEMTEGFPFSFILFFVVVEKMLEKPY